MKIYSLFFVLLLSEFLVAQEAFKKNDLYLEAGGNGIFGSVNYMNGS